MKNNEVRQIINGKMYNTATATYVASYTNGYPSSDFHAIREEIYLKRTGEWFLYGEGGALTKYAEECGNRMWCEGSRIEPLTEKEARQWMEEHASVDTYIKYFGEVAE